MSSGPAFRWRLSVPPPPFPSRRLKSRSHHPNANLPLRSVPSSNAWYSKSETQQGPDRPGKAKPAERASVSLLIGPFTDKAPKTPSTPSLRQISLQGAAAADRRLARPGSPLAGGKGWRPKSGATPAAGVRVLTAGKRALPGWGLAG